MPTLGALCFETRVQRARSSTRQCICDDYFRADTADPTTIPDGKTVTLTVAVCPATPFPCAEMTPVYVPVCVPVPIWMLSVAASADVVPGEIDAAIVAGNPDTSSDTGPV